jgi:hypothetical protein
VASRYSTSGSPATHSAVDPQAHQGDTAVAAAHRVGDRDHLHVARLGEALHAFAHGALAEAELGGHLGERGAPVALQVFDDRPVGVVELHG